MPGGWIGSDRRSRLPPDWPAIRARILARDPLCTGCGQTPSTDVDHIHHGDNHDEANLRGLCARCHSRKSSVEGNAARRRVSERHPAEPHPGMRR
jgi:5-methylcytosine-specific restriction protein A